MFLLCHCMFHCNVNHLPFATHTHTQQTRKQDKEVLGDLFRGRGKGGVDPSTNKKAENKQFQETCFGAWGCLCICCLSKNDVNDPPPPMHDFSQKYYVVNVVSFCHWLHSGDVAVYCNSSRSQQIAGRERHLSHPTWDVYPLT